MALGSAKPVCFTAWTRQVSILSLYGHPEKPAAAQNCTAIILSTRNICNSLAYKCGYFMKGVIYSGCGTICIPLAFQFYDSVLYFTFSEMLKKLWCVHISHLKYNQYWLNTFSGNLFLLGILGMLFFPPAIET